MKVEIGKTYKVKKAVAKKHKIHQDVICANDGGSEGFYALALRTVYIFPGESKVDRSATCLVIKYVDLIGGY